MKIRKLLTGGAAVTAVLAVPVLCAQIVMGYALNYSNMTMYFSGHEMTGWTPPAGVTSVNPIYVGGQFPDGSTEPGVNGSSGYVIPNKAPTFALIADPSDAGGAGGATGFNALGLASVGGDPMRDDPDRKQKLYDLLVDLNQNGTNWERMGSAFVVYKMIGRAPVNGPWVGAPHTISSTDWQELEDRLVSNPDLEMTYDASFPVLDEPNTNGVQYFQGGTWRYDVIDNILEENDPDVDSPVQPAWVFTDASDGDDVVFILEVNCANAMGGLAPLPDYEVPVVDVELDKSVDGNNDGTFSKSEEIQIGVPFSYRVRVWNVGPATATGVVVEDVLPAGVTVLGGTASQGSAAPLTGLAPLVSWNVGTIPVDVTHNIVMQVVVYDADVAAYLSAMQDGVSRNFAQVSAMNETDIDSTRVNMTDPYDPSNHEDEEDHADTFIVVTTPNTGVELAPTSLAGLLGLAVAIVLAGVGIYRYKLVRQ